MENMVVRTLFLLDIPRDLSEGKRGRSHFFFGRQDLPEVSGSPSCPRLQVPGASRERSRLNVKWLHRRGRPFWGDEPCDRLEPRKPGTAWSVRGGQDCFEERRPARVCAELAQGQGRTAGRNRRFPHLKTGRQPER